MTNMHPADELAWLRAEIRRLARREAELRDRFVTGEAPLEGVEARVIVRSSRRAVFRRERLPSDLLSDPALWDTQTTHTVTVQQRGREGLAPAPKRNDSTVLVASA